MTGLALAALMASSTIATPCPDARPVHVGDVVACEGLLIPIAHVERASRCLVVDLPTCRSLRRRDAAECSARLGEVRDQRDAEGKRADALDHRLSTLLAPPPVRSWWEHPALWGGVGIIVGVGASVAVYAALR